MEQSTNEFESSLQNVDLTQKPQMLSQSRKQLKPIQQSDMISKGLGQDPSQSSIKFRTSSKGMKISSKTAVTSTAGLGKNLSSAMSQSATSGFSEDNIPAQSDMSSSQASFTRLQSTGGKTAQSKGNKQQKFDQQSYEQPEGFFDNFKSQHNSVGQSGQQKRGKFELNAPQNETAMSKEAPMRIRGVNKYKPNVQQMLDNNKLRYQAKKQQPNRESVSGEQQIDEQQMRETFFKPKKTIPKDQQESELQFEEDSDFNDRQDNFDEFRTSNYNRPFSARKSNQYSQSNDKQPHDNQQNLNQFGGGVDCQKNIVDPMGSTFGSSFYKPKDSPNRTEEGSQQITNQKQSDKANIVKLGADGGMRFLKELPDDTKYQDKFILEEDYLKKVLRKFQMTDPKVACFNQQIRLEPEGDLLLNAPNLQATVVFQEIQDLINRLRLGMLWKDLRTLLRTCLQQGELCENQALVNQATQNYKSMFLLARALNDSAATMLALNRLGIIYFVRLMPKASQRCHEKHFFIAEGSQQFIPVYNITLACRASNDLERAVMEMNRALALAKFIDDKESESLCHGQSAVVYFEQGNFSEASMQFDLSLQIAAMLKAHRIRLESFLCLAYMAFEQAEWHKAKQFFDQAYFEANECGENKIGEQCLCNAGIASGNLIMEQPQTQNQLMQTFYKGIGLSSSDQANAKGQTTFNFEPQSDEDEESGEDQEATY